MKEGDIKEYYRLTWLDENGGDDSYREYVTGTSLEDLVSNFYDDDYQYILNGNDYHLAVTYSLYYQNNLWERSQKIVDRKDFFALIKASKKYKVLEEKAKKAKEAYAGNSVHVVQMSEYDYKMWEEYKKNLDSNLNQKR